MKSRYIFTVLFLLFPIVMTRAELILKDYQDAYSAIVEICESKGEALIKECIKDKEHNDEEIFRQVDKTMDALSSICSALYSGASFSDCVTRAAYKSQAILKQTHKKVIEALTKWDQSPDTLYNDRAKARLKADDKIFARYREAHCAYHGSLAGGRGNETRRRACLFETNMLRAKQLEESLIGLRLVEPVPGLNIVEPEPGFYRVAPPDKPQDDQCAH